MSAPDDGVNDVAAIAVREMRPLDAAAISAILRESPEAASWSEASLRDAAQSGTAWVSESNGTVVGFLIGRGVVEEFEILNLAVAQTHRRRGVAKRLLQETIACAWATGTQRIFLEVRASNQAAMALYVQNGFKLCGRRVRYYQYPEEDALVLSRNIGEGI